MFLSNFNKSKAKSNVKSRARLLFIGLFLILLSIGLYGYNEYLAPQFEAVKKAQKHQNQLWLSSFESLGLTNVQKNQIEILLKKFDNDKRLSQKSVVKHESEINKTIRSDASPEEKLQETSERINGLFKSVVDLKKSDFYHLRQVYFDVLTPQQRAKFLQQNPVVLEPKPVLAKKMEAEVPMIFKGMDLTDEQKARALNIVDLPKLIDIAYQREVTNYRIHSEQFLNEVNQSKVDALFDQLLQEYVSAYNLHKEQYEKIYSQVLTEKQRKGLSKPGK